MLLSGGIAFGLCAALAFGLSDFLSALLSRRFGALYTLSGVQVVGVLLFLIYFLSVGEIFSLQMIALPLVLLIGAGLALLDSLAYFSFYTALSIGPVAVVSPLTASCAAITVLLAIAVGELPTFWQGIGICAILAGVILTSLHLSVPPGHALVAPGSGIWRRVIQGRSGTFFAGLAMLGFGLHLFLLSRWTHVIGPLAAVFFIRVFSALFLGGITVFSREETLPGRFTFKGLVAITLLGLLDTAGLLAYAIGTTQALTSIVTALESSYSLIPICLGILVFRERLVRIQWVGVAAILLGLLVLAGVHG